MNFFKQRRTFIFSFVSYVTFPKMSSLQFLLASPSYQSILWKLWSLHSSGTVLRRKGPQQCLLQSFEVSVRLKLSSSYFSIESLKAPPVLLGTKYSAASNFIRSPRPLLMLWTKYCASFNSTTRSYSFWIFLKLRCPPLRSLNHWSDQSWTSHGSFALTYCFYRKSLSSEVIRSVAARLAPSYR